MQLNSISLSIFSDEEILKQSKGEVKSDQVFRRGTKDQLHPDGLFSTRIFGPTKSFTCDCGASKGSKRNVVKCPKCGVETVSKFERRRRLGHISLELPVVIPWVLNLPHKYHYISTSIGLTPKQFVSLARFETYYVVQSNNSKIKAGEFLQFNEAQMFFGDPSVSLMSGAKCIEKLLIENRVYFDTKEDNKLKNDSEECRNDLANKGINLTDFIHYNIPVIPPDLRPIVYNDDKVLLNGLNDLYRRVIMKSEKIKTLVNNLPDYIINHEQSSLQNAVECLLDNSKAKHSIRDTHGALIPSVFTRIKGKKGRFRYSLLGKRQDFSGRSVITPGPELSINECALPRKMAYNLFKAHILGYLMYRLGMSSKQAKRTYRFKGSEALDALEHVIKGKYILLNRQPTLHNLGIQAFKPTLINNKAIRLHPLVCQGFNADFDGDQMAVYLPLSKEANDEARDKILMENNLFSKSSGDPIVNPTLEAALGLYLLSMIKKNNKSIRKFATDYEVEFAIEDGVINSNDKITFQLTHNKGKTERFETCYGRVKIWNCLSNKEDFDFNDFNKLLKKSSIKKLISKVYSTNKDIKETVLFIDRINKIGFESATDYGISIGSNDFSIPPEICDGIKDEANKYDKELMDMYNQGLIDEDQMKEKSINNWINITDKIEDDILEYLGSKVDDDGICKNNLFLMADSGARGSKAQIRQLVGLKGVMKSISGGTKNATVVRKPLIEGLSPTGMMRTITGSRSGLLDTALKTSFSGYLARIMVKALEPIKIKGNDCGTTKGIELPIDDCFGRCLLETIGEIPVNTIIDEKILVILKALGYKKLTVRGASKCNHLTVEGKSICKRCYGMDLSTRELPLENSPVGVIAAQSISEPTTQLTLRTFHSGGSVHKEGDTVYDITDGAKLVKSSLSSSIKVKVPDPKDNDKLITKTKKFKEFRERFDIIDGVYKDHQVKVDSKHIEIACSVAHLCNSIRKAVFMLNEGWISKSAFERIHEATADAVFNNPIDNLTDDSAKIVLGKLV